MGRHRLPKGAALIDALSALGEVLGYSVEREFPVTSITRTEPPAVDVAWFAEQGQRFPLFIFEVESAPTNAIANNALKVYAQDSLSFEKPLFFFHLVVAGGSDSHRIVDLQRQYGSHNYRIYKLGKDQGGALVADILSQHRRIRGDVEYADLCRFFANQGRCFLADPAAVLRTAADLRFNNSPLASYIHLSRTDPSVFRDLPIIVEREYQSDWAGLGALEAYVGHAWGIPVLCAFMTVADHDNAPTWEVRFLQWQNGSSYMPRITPAFGLSRDYDEFLLGVAPPLVTLCAAVSDQNLHLPRELSRLLGEIIQKLPHGRHGVHAAAWTCHIAARYDDAATFRVAIDYIDRSGGLPVDNVVAPKSVITLDEIDGGTRNYPPGKSLANLITAGTFRAAAIAHHCATSSRSADLTLTALDDHRFIYEWADPILQTLWGTQQPRQ